MYYLPQIIFAALVLFLIPFALYYAGMVIFAIFGDIIVRQQQIMEMMEEEDEHDNL